MVGKKNIRSYEVSIWTLQDSFITVLKPLNLEYKGAIQDGKITLQDDGENRISFSIPMYIKEKGEFIENPLWYNTEDGNLIANLRKLKVIFNKKTQDERVFEFIITKVIERHEGFEKICDVEGESLAFNELGKQGYKISLSEEDLYNKVSNKLDALKTDDSTEGISVKNNINYWIDKVLAGTNWSYSIQMDWSIIDGIIDQYEEGATHYSDLTEEQRATLNFNRESNGLRRHDRIYEDAYVSSWSISNNALVPAAVVESTEKLRMVEGNESNRYNLLQSIAEAFEVYTKYKYYYDKNYHIIGREVIFYNNFLDENNTIDLTYDYDTQSISRELDAADIVTKMYVKTLDDESYPSGLASIMDTEANKTGEDYILNFDYLYDIKTISEEQYTAIKVFEKDIANLNKQIKPLDNSIIKLESKLIDREVARDNALAMMKEAEENINFITEQLKAITEDSNYSSIVKVVKENPAFIFLSKEKNNYLGKFGSQFSGIVPGTVKVYSDSNCTIPVKFSQKIKNNMVQNLIFTNTVGANISNGYLYAIFDYRPALEKEKLQEDYQTLYNRNKKIYEQNLSKASEIENSIKTKKATRENLYTNKTKLISDFENMMGPALREGNWQPEDEYVGYGDQYDENVQPSYDSSAISTTSGKLKFIWDKELFDEEEENYYEYGINQQKVYYPCIDLTKINSNIFEKLKEEEFRNGLSFVYKNSGESNPYLLPQGVNCKFAFIQPTSGGNIIPVLMITNLFNEINIINDTTANTALAYLTSLTSYIAYVIDISIILSTITVDNSTIFSVPSGAWIKYPNNYKIVYPRLEIQSDSLKTGTNELLLHIYREKADPTDLTGKRKVYTYIDKLEEFIDYSIFSRDEKKYITIKPEVLFAGKIGEAKIKINYCLANTALQIYLDAIEVMKENAYPKVSYTINQLFSPKLFYNTYDRLGQLAHINDAKLKFKNVMGYISAVELNLDNPWEDNITIQNYKNKFEDLFSTIVAQTEDMKKNAYRINAAANAFSANGLLTAEITPESLLKSTRVLNNLIKQNADVIAAKAISEAAKDKAALASTDAYRIMHGEVGLAFKGNKIDSVVLNQDKGLIIAGKTGTTNVFFQLDNAEMGFFKGTPGTFNETNPAARPVPQLYYENGNLALSGIMYAASGWFGGENGWVIGSNELPFNTTTTGLGGLLYSFNGKAIFTSGTDKTDPMIILTKTGFSLDEQNAALLFNGTNLYINGTITSTAGNIGGWYIGSSYLGNKITQLSSTVGMASDKDSSEQSQKYSFWAGGTYNGTGTNIPKFSVTPTGYLTSTSGSIATWSIGTNQLNSGSGETYVALNSGAYNSSTNPNGEYAIWAGAESPNKANFSVTKAGALTAAKGTIGGWTINPNRLYNKVIISEDNTNKNYFAGIRVDGTYVLSIGADEDEEVKWNNAPFRVTHKGKVYATSAEISGKITAESGTIGGFTISSTSDSNKTTAAGGHCYPHSLYTHLQNDNTEYELGLRGSTTDVSGNYSAIYVKEITKGGTWSSTATSNFYLNYNGELYASKADITGAIKATSGTIGQTDAPKIHIGSTSNASTSPSWIYSGSKTAYDSSNSGFYIGTDGIALGAYDSTSGHSPFEVDTSGALYAIGAIISGTINARSGTIGQEKAPKITIGSSENTSTAISRIYSSTKSTLDSDTIDGFYLGTNGLALGKGLFKVTNTGVLTTKKGTIAGWSFDDKKFTSDSGKIGISTENYSFWAGHATPSSAPFSVEKSGILHASKANITEGSYLGGWYVGGNYIGNGKTRGESKVGMSWVNNSGYAAFWAGGKPQTNSSLIDLTKTPFYVTNEGALSASNVKITGGELGLVSKGIITMEKETGSTINYTGTLSINQNHNIQWDNETKSMPLPFFLREELDYYGEDKYTNWIYYFNGALYFRENSISFNNSTSITSTFIQTSRLDTKNVSLESETSTSWHGNYLSSSGFSVQTETENNMSTSTLTSSKLLIKSADSNIELLASGPRAGLYDNDNETWIIYKNFSNGNIYIRGNIYIQDSNGDFKKLTV